MATATATTEVLTKRSKNKDIAEAYPELMKQNNAFIYAVGETNGNYKTFYVAQPIERVLQVSQLKADSLGWSTKTLKRGFITVDITVVNKNANLKALYSTILKPLTNISLKISETTTKPYERAEPRIKPAKDTNDEDQVLTINNMPIYEVVELDYGQLTESRIDGSTYLPRSIFDTEFVILSKLK